MKLIFSINFLFLFSIFPCFLLLVVSFSAPLFIAICELYVMIDRAPILPFIVVPLHFVACFSILSGCGCTCNREGSLGNQFDTESSLGIVLLIRSCTL